tara:strand:- start:48 stop:425 length:378 start_codon:yes stop_codon:yes gene_type:complete
LTFDVLKLLEQEGYIKDGEDNVVYAEKAFFAARVMQWIRKKVATEPDFNLTAYLTMLMYYKTGMAELKFLEDEDKLVYRMCDPDSEVQEIVDSLVKSLGESPKQTSETGGEDSDAPKSPNRDPKS